MATLLREDGQARDDSASDSDDEIRVEVAKPKEEASKRKSKGYKHKWAVLFHMLFRTLAIVVYLLCSLVSSNFVTNFIFVVLLLSLDFWTVKNVSGRLLVGMRWWNKVNDDGTSKWVFESRKEGKSKRESRLFWYSLYIYCGVWVVLGTTALIGLKLQWLLVVCVALSLNIANVVGYTKCERDAKAKMASVAGDLLGSNFVSGALSSVGSGLMSSVASAMTKK